jgi:hypothetical protein
VTTKPRVGLSASQLVVQSGRQSSAAIPVLSEFDFLRGPELYKLLYTSSSRSVLAFRVAAGVRGHAVCLGDRVLECSIVAARRRLPDSGRERLTGRADPM